MGNDFSNSLFGYNKKQVSDKLEKLDNEFNLKVKEFKLKEKELRKENLKLLDEVNNLKNNIKDNVALENILSQVLNEAHLESVTILYNAEKKLDEMINSKNEVVKALEKKNEKINSDIRSLMNSINEEITD